MKLAFLGLGVMGFPMAGHLLKSDEAVCVFNRNPERSQDWMNAFGLEDGASRAMSIEEACQDVDMIFTCVGNDNDLREVMLGDKGVLASVKAGALICDHTTSSAALAREIHEQAKQKNIAFLDAPVSGGQKGAQDGKLSIMVGGSIEAYERVLPKLQCYGKTIERIGESGTGQLAKMVNQICIAGVLEGLSEALFFGQKLGLDLEKVLSVISGGAAQSWQMDNRAHTMLRNEFDFGFAVDWMRKDLAFVIEEAERAGIELELVKNVDGYYSSVQKAGGGRWDTSSLITRLHAQENKK